MILLTPHSFPSSTFPFSSLPRSISPYPSDPSSHTGFSSHAHLLVPSHLSTSDFDFVGGSRLNTSTLPIYLPTAFPRSSPTLILYPHIPPRHVSSVLLLGYPSRFVLLNPSSRLLRSSCPMWSISRSSPTLPLYPHIPPRHVSSVLLLGFLATPFLFDPFPRGLSFFVLSSTSVFQSLRGWPFHHHHHSSHPSYHSRHDSVVELPPQRDTLSQV